MKTKKRIFFTFLFFLLYFVVPLERIQAQSESGGCDREIASKGSENKLELVPNETLCITGDLVYSDISWADGATLRVAPGKTLTIQNNMSNNTNSISLTIELYGTLIMGNPEFNPNLTLNIYSGGKFETSGNATFKGNDVTINNEGIFDVKVLNLNGDNSKVLIQNGPKAEFLINENLNVGNSSTLFFQNEGKLDIQSQFGLSPTSVYSNCGNITTKGFNLQKGKVINTGVMVIEENLDGEGTIENYGQITLTRIQGSGKTFINHGKVEVTSNSVVDITIKGPKDPGIYGEFSWKGQVNGLNNLYVYGNQIFKNTVGESSQDKMLSNSSALKPDSQSSIVWGECEDCTVIFTGKGCFDVETGELEPGPNPDPTNYWIGGKIDAPNDWDKEENWTGGFVPEPGDDIEFATEVNNPTVADDPNSGPAKDHLYLGDDRVIGDLINDSDKDLWVTTGDQLIINGEVKDNNPDGGTIVVKASPDEPSGTLIFDDLLKNQNVGAIVEFYNQAHDCEDCGFYTRSWQYFGIPVQEADFPADDVFGTETVNQWVEPFNGNKWQPAPYTPDTELKAFKGYQITNDVTEQPEDVYGFAGKLYVGDTSVALTRTDNVNYPGVNLVGNSYTAAIPISQDALTFPSGEQQTVYLFNTGTRDQWRKLNGSAVNKDGYRSGQYLAVPVNLGGQDNFPDRIPSMHAFMLLAESGTGNVGNLGIDYSKLIKNTAVNRGDDSQIVTRSAGNEGTATSTTTSLPSLVMDVIGEQSADRVWIFAKEGASHGFDNGWDGRKMAESGIAQLYVTGSDESQLQVATVPTMENVLLGFEADADGKYTLEFSLSEQLNTVDIHLQDLVTGMSQRLSDGGSYQFEAKKGDTAARFRLSQSGEFKAPDDEALIDIEPAGDGKVMIRNHGGSACTAFISNDKGAVLQRVEVSAGGEKVLENMSAGVYVIRLQNATVNDARRVVVN